MTGELAALAAAFVWAVGNLMLKPLSTRFHPVFLNYVRCIAAASLFAIILMTTGKFTGLSHHVPLQSAIIAIIGTFVGIGIGDSLFVLSLRYLDISRAYPIPTCGYPLVAVSLACLLLQERLSLMTLGGTLLALSGLYFITFHRGPLLMRFSFTSPQERTGLLLLLLTALAWGVSIIGIKVGTAGLDMAVANFMRYTGTAILLTPLALTRWWRFWKSSGWRQLAYAGLNGAFTFGVGAIFFLFALEHSGAARTSVLSSTSPLFLVPLAVFFLKEKITPRLLLGIVLSVLGISVVFLA